MSTLSFQDYVRERMMRKRHESTLTTIPADRPQREPQSERPHPTLLENAQIKKEVITPKAATPRKSAAPSLQSDGVSQGIVDELHAMKELMEDRFNALAWRRSERRQAAGRLQGNAHEARRRARPLQAPEANETGTSLLRERS